eukprot:3340621-Pyramimonas_sp.AAC.1
MCIRDRATRPSVGARPHHRTQQPMLARATGHQRAVSHPARPAKRCTCAAAAAPALMTATGAVSSRRSCK